MNKTMPLPETEHNNYPLVTWTPTGNLMTFDEFEHCGVNLTFNLIAGKWKPVILQHLVTGEVRFMNLWRMIPRVSKKVLLQQLRQLEADGLVQRHEHLKFPPEVSYALTPKGQSLIPVLVIINQWALTHLDSVLVRS